MLLGGGLGGMVRCEGWDVFDNLAILFFYHLDLCQRFGI
jgi:hypothetical protein